MRFHCPHCGCEYNTPDDSAAGRRVKCRDCDEVFTASAVPIPARRTRRKPKPAKPRVSMDWERVAAGPLVRVTGLIVFALMAANLWYQWQVMQEKGSDDDGVFVAYGLVPFLAVGTFGLYFACFGFPVSSFSKTFLKKRDRAKAKFDFLAGIGLFVGGVVATIVLNRNSDVTGKIFIASGAILGGLALVIRGTYTALTGRDLWLDR